MEFFWFYCYIAFGKTDNTDPKINNNGQHDCRYDIEKPLLILQETKCSSLVFQITEFQNVRDQNNGCFCFLFLHRPVFGQSVDHK